MDYILEISYSPAPELDDRVEGILFLTSCAGSQIGEREGATIVSCYFATREDRAGARGMLEGVEGLGLEDHDRERLDWLELYRQSLEPIFIGARFVVVPDPSLVPPDSDRIPIVIPQERAFGTGSHDTTALCLEKIETMQTEGARCLDIGTGSGILAIGMAKLGARHTSAFDNDPETWEVLPKNLVRNRVPEGAIGFFIGGIDAVLEGARFDLITMNILPDVIIPNLPAVARMLAPAGSLILSGVLTIYRDEVLAAVERAGLSLQSEATSREWWCGVVGQRSNAEC